MIYKFASQRSKRRPFFRRLSLLLLAALLLPLSGCSPQRYEKTYIGYFDTVTSISGYFPSQQRAEAEFSALLSDISRYHQLCDAYNSYPGLVNIKTLNDNAGGEPLKISAELMELLLYCKKAYSLTNGCVNVCMGSVLLLWHDARQAAEAGAPYLPGDAALQEAAQHTDIAGLQLDEADKTARLADPEMRLDVGAVAKGWAAGKAAEAARERGNSSLLLSMGGNVCAAGAKPNGPWQVGVQDPFDPSGIYTTAALSTGCLVTSGSYQRYFELGGVRYCHIIDPDTLYPASRCESVTVLDTGGDSALCDALSTALFILPVEEGLLLAERCAVEALWVFSDGSSQSTPGFFAQ